MLIRTEQLHELNRACQADFERRVSAFVRQTMPLATAALNKDQLSERIGSHIATARGFGLRTQLTIAQFVCLAFLPGPPFYENRYLAAFLRSPKFESDAKMDCIVNLLSRKIDQLINASTA